MVGNVCIVTGVGQGTGQGVVRRFAEGGYRVAMLARNTERLTQFEREIAETTAYPCDISNEAEVNATVTAIAEQLGSPTVLIHNAVSFEAIFGTFLEIDPAALQHNFQVNTMGLLYMARAVTPYMLEAGQGAIMVTGNTASRRGRPQFAAFAPTKTAQRILAESIARTLGPQGIHVSFLVIDGGIDMPFARTLAQGQTGRLFHSNLGACRHDLARRPPGPLGLDL